jgi:predicted RNA-binding Zn-ribbon protein involved in translation (DUF1610 family)
LTHDLPGSLVLSLPLENRYPRGFSVYPTASQPAVFALAGYPVYLADSQSARFLLDVGAVREHAMMNCPECGSASVQSLGKRNFPYPVAFILIFPLVLAMLHQAASPIDYRCPSCGLRFARRTGTGRFALVVIIVIVGASVLLMMFFLLQPITP